MNIFVLHETPVHAATQHCDKHVVKMILEYAQLLSTAHRILDGTEATVQYTTPKGKARNKKVWSLTDSKKDELLYKATHINHPCAVWVRESISNYMWTHDLLSSLCNEYYYRYGQHKKTDQKHKVERSGLLNELSYIPIHMTATDRTPFVQCMPDEFKHSDAVQAYRNLYLGGKSHLLKYTSREQPEWI
jgi:hypothetical protein